MPRYLYVATTGIAILLMVRGRSLYVVPHLGTLIVISFERHQVSTSCIRECILLVNVHWRRMSSAKRRHSGTVFGEPWPLTATARSSMKMSKRIGDSRDPWKRPFSKRTSSVRLPFTAITVEQPDSRE